MNFKGKPNYSNIYSNPNYILVSPNTTTTYRINSFSDANCLGQSSGNAIVTVNSIAGVVNTTIGSNCASTDGLVAYYPFDGNANDASGNGNNGTIFGATLTNNRFGNPNNAFQFNGALESDYIESDIVISGSFTISIWYKADVGSSIIDYPTMFHLFKNSNVRQETVINAIANQSGYGINRYKSIVRITNSLTDGLNQFSRIYPIEGEWNHTTVVYDDSRKTSSFYTNGILESEETFNQNFTLNSSIKARVGGNYQLGSNSFFKGVLDEFRIYNRALTDCEIKKLYDCNSTCSSPPVNCTSTDGLVAYYPFDGNANDASGNGNNANFNNATLTTDKNGKVNSAYSFNNTSIKVNTISPCWSSSSNLSVSAWIKPTVTNRRQEIIIFGEKNLTNSAITLYIESNGLLRVC
ncbi:MAG: LamG domain-containing protein [Cytophagales bacterium]|nr:MAG: LamG domain-containing protein [Cytophagales bacterium]